MTTVYSADWVLPIDGAPIERGGVAVRNDRIVAVGPADELTGTHEHFPACVILPGLVNAHTHLEYSVYAGFGDGLADFGDWIATHVRRKRRLDWEGHLAVARLGAAECLATGVTTVGDCSYRGAGAVAAKELGLRATIYLEVFGSEPDDVLRQFGELQASVEGAFDERVQLGISPHAPYSISPAAYRACAGLGLPMATHLSESRSELLYLLDDAGPWRGLDFLVPSPGMTGPRLLEREGLLGPGLLAAHCTQLEPDEIELLGTHQVGVAHCPRSNAVLGCGTAPAAELAAAGARVGLGTDGVSSAPSLDLFEEMRVALYAARVRLQRPDALSAREALELATLGSARALGLDREIGSLAPGKKADLAILSLEGSAFLPWEDPVVAVVLGGTPARVSRTIVDGATRYVRGGFEWHELRQRAAAARARMLASG